MIVSDPATQPAVAAFRELIEADPKAIRQEYATIEAELTRRRILFGNKPLPICIAPAMITQQRLKPIGAAMTRLIRILAKLEAPLRESHWMDKLGISPEEQELIQLPSGLPPGGYISRVDGFLGPPQGADLGYRIVELNVDSPGGAAFMDECVKLLRATTVWKKFTQRFPGRYLDTNSRDLKLLLDAWKAWGGKGKPHIAVVDWATVNTASEFDLLKERYRKRGFDTVVADPRELQYVRGRLVDYDGVPIDLVYRRVLVEDLLAHGAEAQALVHAYRDNAVCMVNPFACKPLTVKSLLSLVHTDDFDELLSVAELKFLRSLMPWTADVKDGPVVERIRNNRETLVMKPADGYGGQGLYLGWEMTQADWEKGLEGALKERYVAQERVFIPQAEFPVPKKNGWGFSTFRVDFDPYMFGGGMGDPLVRVATSDVLNVKAGAQIAATWVLD